MALDLFLQRRNENATPDFWIRHSSLWADNGDVSHILHPLIDPAKKNHRHSLKSTPELGLSNLLLPGTGRCLSLVP